MNPSLAKCPVRFYYYLHFTSGGAEAQKGQVTCQGHTAEYLQSDSQSLATKLQDAHPLSLRTPSPGKAEHLAAPGQPPTYSDCWPQARCCPLRAHPAGFMTYRTCQAPTGIRICQQCHTGPDPVPPRQG